MRFLEMKTLLVAAAINGWLLPDCYASIADKIDSDKACVVTVQVAQNNEVYRNLAVLKYGKMHMTCPVNVATKKTATIYILHEGGVCLRGHLFGYTVLSRKMLTNANARVLYDQCSGVIRLNNRTINLSHTVAYLWRSALPKASERQQEMDAIFGRLVGGIISSGLPILKFDNLNNAFCFEVDAEFKKDLMAAIRDIGVAVPASIQQTRYFHSSCDALLRMR